MNKGQKKIAKAFCSEVKKQLCCSYSMKSVFMKELRGRISEFFDANPDATREELEQNFGAPADIASGFTAREDLDDLRKKARRAVIYKIAAIVLLVALALAIYILSEAIQEHTITITTIDDGTIKY